MKAGYARVSTKDQTVDLQVDALKKAGCAKVYTEVMNGSRAERPILSKVLEHLRAGDVLVIWKLDRLGRSLKHLIEVVNELMTRKIGLKSLNDPIDTTTPQGRLIFNLFASLSEFERDVIRERTQAGLSAARARGRIVSTWPKKVLSNEESRRCRLVSATRDKWSPKNIRPQQLTSRKLTLPAIFKALRGGDPRPERFFAQDQPEGHPDRKRHCSRPNR